METNSSEKNVHSMYLKEEKGKENFSGDGISKHFSAFKCCSKSEHQEKE
jgi:hypothetical protein